MSNKNKSRIFLCHASEDKEYVLKVYDEFKRVGLSPWLDKNDLLPGQNWDNEIKLALKNAQIVVIFFSQNSVSKRGYVQKEFKLALDTLREIPEGQIFIIPIKLDDCKIPNEFSELHYADFSEEEDLNSIINVIYSELGLASELTDITTSQTFTTEELFNKLEEEKAKINELEELNRKLKGNIQELENKYINQINISNISLVSHDKSIIHFKDIIYIKADRNLVKIITTNKVLHQWKSLRSMNELLPKSLFIQVNRTYIINSLHIKTVNSMLIEMNNGKVITVGMFYRAKFREFIKFKE